MAVQACCGQACPISRYGRLLGEDSVRESGDSDAGSGRIRFDGFASYAASPDARLVCLVEALVEGFHRRPGIARHLVKELSLCVDGSDFVYGLSRPATPEGAGPYEQRVERTILDNMRAARCLLVFTGPLTRGHFWVEREIKIWRETFPERPVYVALTHGHDDWSPSNFPATLDITPRSGDASWFDLRGYYRLPLAERAYASLLLAGGYLSSLMRSGGAPAGRQREAYRRTVSAVRGEALDPRDMPGAATGRPGGRMFGEEVARLAAQLVFDARGQPGSLSDLQKSYIETERRQRRRTRRLAAAGLSGTAASVVAGLILNDRQDRLHQAAQLASEAQIAADAGAHEIAIERALEGLPVRWTVPWAPGWSDPVVARLQATLAGAAQGSALIGVLDERPAGPEAGLTAVAFDPSGSRIATASETGVSSVYEFPSLRRVASCRQRDAIPKDARTAGVRKGNTPWVRDTRFGSDGSLVSAGPHGHFWTWRMGAASCGPPASMVWRPHTDDVRTATFSPAGGGLLVLTTSDDNTVALTDLTSGKSDVIALPEELWPLSYTTSAEFDPSGRTVAVARSDGLVAVIDLATRDRVVLKHDGAHASSARLDRDGRRLVAAAEDGRVYLWTKSEGGDGMGHRVHAGAEGTDPDYLRAWARATLVPVPRQARAVNDAVFSPDGRFLALAGADGTARILDADDLSQKAVLVGHSRALQRAAYSSDGRHLVTASSDGTAGIWDALSNVDRPRVKAHPGGVAVVASSRDVGRILTTSRRERLNRLWSMDATGRLDGGQRLSIEGEPRAAVFGRTGDELILTLSGGGITRYHIAEGSHELLRAPSGREVSTLAVSPDGGRIAFVVDGHAFVLDTRARTTTLLDGIDRVARLAFTTDGARVIAISPQGNSGLWSAANGRREAAWASRLGDIRAIASGADGTRIATGGTDRYARIWAGDDMAEELALRHEGDVYHIQFSRNGKRLVTASGDRSVRIWDAKHGIVILRVELASAVLGAFLSQDETKVVAVMEDGVMTTLDVSWTLYEGANLARKVCLEKLKPDHPVATSMKIPSRIFKLCSRNWRP